MAAVWAYTTGVYTDVMGGPLEHAVWGFGMLFDDREPDAN
jgi:hypothetical protein